MVESEPRLVELAAQIFHGEGIAPDELAEICTNYNDQGNRYTNSHFSNLDVLSANISETNSLLERDIYQLDQRIRYKDALKSPDVVLENADMFLYDFPESPNAIFIGTVLGNARRYKEDSMIANWLSMLKENLLSTDGLLVATLTPQDLYELPSTLDLVQESGFMVSSIICESLAVILDQDTRYIRGDYLGVFFPNHANLVKKIDQSPLHSFSAKAIISDKSSSRETVSRIEFLWPPVNNEFPVGWLNTGNSQLTCYYDILPFQIGERVSRWNRFERELIQLFLGGL
jgi:hypothetical protein